MTRHAEQSANETSGPARGRTRGRGRRAARRVGVYVSSKLSEAIRSALPALIAISLIALVQLALPSLRLLPLLSVTPALTFVLSGKPCGTALTGFTALTVAVVFHIQHGPLDSVSGWYDLSLVTIATGVSCTACLIREGRAQRALARVRSVAEVAQRALLPPMPHRLGPVRLAIRYQPAAADACIGGDFYAAIPTPYGVRVIVGDARGKGLEAVELAATVLGTFRATTHDEPTLRSLARRLDSALERVRGELSDAGCPEPHEEFVTAVLLEINDDGTLEILNCGHEPPILLSASGPKLLDSEEPNLPLGQLTLAAGHLTTHNVPATYWHTLLLHTDGVTEARNRHGIFYPLIDRIPTCMRDNVDDTVGRLHDDLLHHADKHLSDDAVLLAIQREHDDSKTQAPIATTGKAA